MHQIKTLDDLEEHLQVCKAFFFQIHFLSHSWHGGLDYSESAMSEAVNTEKYFNVSRKYN